MTMGRDTALTGVISGVLSKNDEMRTTRSRTCNLAQSFGLSIEATLTKSIYIIGVRWSQTESPQLGGYLRVAVEEMRST